MSPAAYKPVVALNCAAAIGDRHFHYAVLAALPLWLAGYLWLQPALQWDWPLRRPRELLYLGLLYPVLEEVVFRGLLQGGLLARDALRRRWLGLSLANWATSLVFVGLHFIGHPPLAAAAVLPPALVFGHLRDRHGALCAPIVLHVYYNIGYFWIFGT